MQLTGSNEENPVRRARYLPIQPAASTMDDFPVSAAAVGADEHRPRLVLRFALYAGAVLLAAGLAIAWLVNREVANRAAAHGREPGTRGRRRRT